MWREKLIVYNINTKKEKGIYFALEDLLLMKKLSSYSLCNEALPLEAL